MNFFILKNIFGLFSFLYFFSCNGDERKVISGSVLYKFQVFDKETKSFIKAIIPGDRKAWFSDSLVIWEGSHLDIETDSTGKQTHKSYVGEYMFCDLRTRSFYEYLNFSDSAKITDMYLQPDTGNNKRGWNFFADKTNFKEEILEHIPDTVINGITYKRIRCAEVFDLTDPEHIKLFGKKYFQITIGYLRPDLKGLVFSLDKIIEKKTGYPVVRIDNIAPNNNIYTIAEVKLLSDTLTDEEKRVFKAWYNNAKNNPIKK